MFYREKRYYVKNYLEIDIIPRTKKAEKAVRGNRKRKQKVSRPQQNNLNDKNSKRYLNFLAKGNFNKDDIYLTLTYSNKHLPKNIKAAEKEATNFLRRIAYRRDKKGLSKSKYILITEFKEDEDEDKEIIRVHHHLLINKGLNRDEIEEAWAKGRGKNKERIGIVNTKRLQLDESTGIESVVNYLTKAPRWKKGKKRWSSSQNLKKPVMTKNDWKYRQRQLEKLALSSDCGKEYFERMYPKYLIISIEPEYYELTGWHFYLKMWRKEENNRDG